MKKYMMVCETWRQADFYFREFLHNIHFSYIREYEIRYINKVSCKKVYISDLIEIQFIPMNKEYEMTLGYRGDIRGCYSDKHIGMLMDEIKNILGGGKDNEEI